jgi:hypothetical protein
MQKIDDVANRQFAFIMTIACIVFGSIIPFIKGKNLHNWLNILAIIFLFFGLFGPKYLQKTRLIWLKFGEFLGKINTKIIFTFIYLSVFSFVHFIQFLIGRDRLKKRFKKYQTTYEIKEKISSFNDPF